MRLREFTGALREKRVNRIQKTLSESKVILVLILGWNAAHSPAHFDDCNAVRTNIEIGEGWCRCSESTRKIRNIR